MLRMTKRSIFGSSDTVIVRKMKKVRKTLTYHVKFNMAVKIASFYVQPASPTTHGPTLSPTRNKCFTTCVEGKTDKSK